MPGNTPTLARCAPAGAHPRAAGRSDAAHTDASLVALAVVLGFVLRAIGPLGDHVVGNDESLRGGVHALVGGNPHTATVLVNLVTATLIILPIAGIAGLALGPRATVLIRPEGLFFVLVLLPVLTLPVLGGWRAVRGAEPACRRRAIGVAGAFVLPLVPLAGPYVVFLHDHTGAWQLTAKSNATSIDAWQALAPGNRRPPRFAGPVPDLDHIGEAG